MAVIAATVLRRIWTEFETATARVVFLALLGGVAVAWLVGIWWSATIGRASLEGRPVATPRPLRRLTVATVLTALLAFVLSVVPYPS